MIFIEDIITARNDRKLFKEIYKTVFYDGSKPKVRMWLKNRGVPYKNLDDMESEMIKVFVENIFKYHHGRIDFERWIWTKFEQALLNSFYRNTYIKKIANLYLADDLIEENQNNIISGISYIFDDIEVDLNNILVCLNNVQCYIFNCKYYNNWNDSEIKIYVEKIFNISPDIYEYEYSEMKKKIYKYIRGEL